MTKLAQLIAMRLAALLLIGTFMAHAQGTFFSGYQAEKGRISFGIVALSTPRSRHDGSSPWVLQWGTVGNWLTRPRADRASVLVRYIDAAGKPQGHVAFVPTSDKAPLDMHNPTFPIPLASVLSIEIKLFDGKGKPVAAAVFN